MPVLKADGPTMSGKHHAHGSAARSSKPLRLDKHRLAKLRLVETLCRQMYMLHVPGHLLAHPSQPYLRHGRGLRNGHCVAPTMGTLVHGSFKPKASMRATISRY